MINRVLLIIFVGLFFIGCQTGGNENDIKTAAAESIKGQPIFEPVSQKHSGVTFLNFIKETLQHNPLVYDYYYNGGGVSIGDINNDGLPDLYFTGNLTNNQLYLNKGNLQFEDITEKAGVATENSWSSGTTMADVNGDGLLDIYVSRSYLDIRPKSISNRLYINNGDMTFTDKAKEYGLADMGYSTQATFFDMDLDGDLDCFLANHSVNFHPLNDTERFDPFFHPKDESTSCKLFRNDGNRFTDISKAAGIFSYSFSLGVVASDMNGDGYPDIYVANDYEHPDRYFINNGNGTFTDKINTDLDHTAFFGMGVDAGDMNNDGLLDLAVVDMVSSDNYRSKTQMASMDIPLFWRLVGMGFQQQFMRNVLQINNGNNSFSEIGQMAGMAKTDWSWAPLFQDFDNDGQKDLFISNGYRRDARNVDFRNLVAGVYKNKGVNSQEELDILMEAIPSQKIYNQLFINNGDLTFKEAAQANGLVDPSFSNGAAYGDLDGDGDLELVINNVEDVAFILKNNSVELGKGNFLQIKLKGEGKNRSGLNAKVEIQTGNQKQFIEHTLTRGYQSSVEDLVHFGLGDKKTVDRVTVTWQDGRVSILQNVKANSRIEIKQSEAQKTAQQPTPVKKMFADAPQNAGVSYVNSENEYDDFAREILIPHKMSTMSPALAAGDLDGDGFDEFFVGGGGGKSGALFRQNADGIFSEISGPWSANKNCEESGAHFFDADGDGDLDLYVSSGSNEYKTGSKAYQDHLYFQTGPYKFEEKKGALPDLKVSTASPVSGDFDGDGDLDLFICGRQAPGEYPRPGQSALLVNENGVFKDMTETLSPGLTNIGMVTDAAFEDFNKDGKIDLLLVGEWMAPTLFVNTGSSFEQKPSGAEGETGWWNSLKTIDIDSDGDTDFIAGNLGLNYKYHAAKGHPFPIYSHDFDKNNKLDIVLGYENKGKVFPLRGRQCSSQQCPQIQQKFPTYHSFGLATLEDVYGADLNEALKYEATNFATCLFENQGDGTFLVTPLPNSAQISVTNGIVAQDLNNDKIIDLVIAGNMFGSEIETGRADAGKGLFLKGISGGKFEVFPTKESGLFIPGDVKNLVALRTPSGMKLVAAKANAPVQIIEINNLALLK